MHTSRIDVAIIGAGPYGLSIASFLAHKGISRRIFGSTMSTWRQMPPTMYLKSFGFATTIPTPHRHYTFPEYCRTRGLEDFEPIAYKTFAEYGEWLQKRLVPDVEQVYVRNVDRNDGGFDLTLETGERVHAKCVVVATGLTYFDRVPEVFSKLPDGFVTHSWDITSYLESTNYIGRDVTVIGAGQSALEAAALLHERGARVRIVVRRDVWWSNRFTERTLKDKLFNPNTVIGPGRRNWVLQHVPMLPYRWTQERRVEFTRRYLGPLGTWWLRDRVENKIPIIRKTQILGASVTGAKVSLSLDVDGKPTEIQTDHVICATGYEPDVDRLPFIGRDLASAIRRVERAPVLSPYFESSVPGLFFVGPIAMFSFGPLVRFVAGSYFSVPRVIGHLVRTLKPKWRTIGSMRFPIGRVDRRYPDPQLRGDAR